MTRSAPRRLAPASLLLALLLGACGTTNPNLGTNPGATPNPTPGTTVSGRVLGALNGANSLQLLMPTSADANATFATVATAALTSDGSFSFVLPTTPPALLSAGGVLDVSDAFANLPPGVTGNCTGGATLSDPTARGNAVAGGRLYAGTTAGAEVVPIEAVAAEGGGVVTGYAYTYVDKAVTVSGGVSCAGSVSSGSATITYNVSVPYAYALPAGWSLVKTVVTTSAAFSDTGLAITANGVVSVEAVRAVNWTVVDTTP